MGVILGNAIYSRAPGPLHMLIPLPRSRRRSVHLANPAPGVPLPENLLRQGMSEAVRFCLSSQQGVDSVTPRP